MLFLAGVAGWAWQVRRLEGIPWPGPGLSFVSLSVFEIGVVALVGLAGLIAEVVRGLSSRKIP